MLTIKQIAARLHINPEALGRWIGKSKITAYRASPRSERRFRQADVELYLCEVYKNISTTC